MKLFSKLYKTIPVSSHVTSLEEQINQWKDYLIKQSNPTVDIAKLEVELRGQIENLTNSGLTDNEAFLIATKRVSRHSKLSREFVNKHSYRLWKQLITTPFDTGTWKDTTIAFCLALAAALAIKVPALFGIGLGAGTTDQDIFIYARNLSLFILPLLTGYFAWKRQIKAEIIWGLTAAFIAAAIFANIYPFAPNSDTGVLTIIHLPIALWLVVGITYAGGKWNEMNVRMDFIRFSGELFIYYLLIALGGGVLTALIILIFNAAGINVIPFVQSWLLPCGAMGAVLIGSWLVESRQNVIENIAPMLARLFTPFFTIAIVVFLATIAWTGNGIGINRNVLIAFDLLLVLVLGLLLYSISARNPKSSPGLFDVMRVVLIISALLADAVALWAIAARITQFGFTPNRAAALGENVVLFVNLAWSAVLYIRFLTGTESFMRLEKWQTDYLPVYATWAAIIVVVFQPLFGYI